MNVGGNCTRRIQVSSPRAISRTRTRLEVERRLFQSLFAELESQKTVERSSLFVLLSKKYSGSEGTLVPKFNNNAFLLLAQQLNFD